MRISFFIIALTLMASALSACNLHRNNAIVPPAYTYHSDEYKSADGQSAKNIGYTYAPVINDKSMEIWSHIAFDLVDRVEQDFNLHKQDIYLVPHQDNTLFINSYAFALQREFLRRGYMLRNTADAIPNIYYEARPAQTPSDNPNLYQNVEFTVTMALNKKILKQASVVDTLPTFYKSVKTSRHYLAALRNLEKNDTPDKYEEYPPPPSYTLGTTKIKQPAATYEVPAPPPALIPKHEPTASAGPSSYYPPGLINGESYPYPPAGYAP